MSHQVFSSQASYRMAYTHSHLDFPPNDEGADNIYSGTRNNLSFSPAPSYTPECRLAYTSIGRQYCSRCSINCGRKVI